MGKECDSNASSYSFGEKHCVTRQIMAVRETILTSLSIKFASKLVHCLCVKVTRISQYSHNKARLYNTQPL